MPSYLRRFRHGGVHGYRPATARAGGVRGRGCCHRGRRRLALGRRSWRRYWRCPSRCNVCEQGGGHVDREGGGGGGGILPCAFPRQDRTSTCSHPTKRWSEDRWSDKHAASKLAKKQAAKPNTKAIPPPPLFLCPYTQRLWPHHIHKSDAERPPNSPRKAIFWNHG